MKNIQIGLQLYSVRNHFENDLERCLARVKEIGYDTVELYGPFLYPAKRVQKALQQNGLTVCGYHTDIRFTSDELIEAVLAYNDQIGNRNIIIPYTDDKNANSREEYEKLADQFTQLSARLQKQDFFAGYHAHNVDFRDVEGFMPWDFLAEHTDPGFILQLDTANALSMGLDASECIARYPGRGRLLHYKPYSLKTAYESMIGEDDLNWPEIIRVTKESSGCETVVVEHETLDENMEHVEQCYRYLKEHI